MSHENENHSNFKWQTSNHNSRVFDQRTNKTCKDDNISKVSCKHIWYGSFHGITTKLFKMYQSKPEGYSQTHIGKKSYACNGLWHQVMRYKQRLFINFCLIQQRHIVKIKPARYFIAWGIVLIQYAVPYLPFIDRCVIIHFQFFPVTKEVVTENKKSLCCSIIVVGPIKFGFVNCFSLWSLITPSLKMKTTLKYWWCDIDFLLPRIRKYKYIFRIETQTLQFVKKNIFLWTCTVIRWNQKHWY